MDQQEQNQMDFVIGLGDQLDNYMQGRTQQLMTHQNVKELTELPMKYSTEQYFLCLVNLIQDTLRNIEKMEDLKKICKIKKFSYFSFRKQFITYMFFINKNLNQLKEDQVKSACILSILEMMMVKLFTSVKPKIYIKALMNVTDKQYYQSKIQEKDFELIRSIVYTKKVKDLILQLNKSKFENQNQTEQQLNEEIEELLKILSEPFYVSPMENNYYGLTCLNGQLIYSENVITYEKQGQDSNIYRALLIITYIHEVFFHLRRIKYCHNNNVLINTPPEFSKDYYLKGGQKQTGEAGEFFEYFIFGSTIVYDNCTLELAHAILKLENWQDYAFKFSSLLNKQIKLQIQKNRSKNQQMEKD